MSTFKMITLSVLLFLVLISGADAGSKRLYVICDEWPPYQIMENNSVSGFSTKIVKKVFDRMQVTLENIDVYPWKRAVKIIQNGMADALFSANFTEDRTAFAAYPEETIVRSPWVMWVREEDGLEFDSYEDLSGKRVGMVRGYSYTPELWDFVKKENNYEEVYNDELNFKKLNAGRIDFIPAELGNGLHIVRTHKLNKIIPLMKKPLKTDGLYIIFNKNSVDEAFVNRFSEELKKLKEEPFYKDLYDIYFRF